MDLVAFTIAFAVAGGPAGPPPADESVARADEILSRPEFAPPERSLFQRVTDWIGERISDLLTNLFGGGQGSFSSWIVLGLCVAVIGVVIFFVVRSLRRDPPVDLTPDDGEVVRSSADWRTEAERFEAAGSWKAALRARYRELIAELVARGVVRDVPGRTTGEYRTEVRRRVPSVADDFDVASALFDAAWYGDLPTGADENRAFRERSRRVVAGTRGSRQPELVGIGLVEVRS